VLKVLLAFLKRDYLLHFSYRFSLLSNIFTVLTFAGTFYYIGHLFKGTTITSLQPFGGNYFSYVLIGLALSNFVGGSLGTLSNQLRQEQLMGTLEAVLATPVSNSLVLFSMNFWNFLVALMDLVVYILVGVLIFHVSLSQVNWPSFLIVLFLTVVSFMSLGTITASVTLIFKGGDNLAGNINVLSDFLGGIYFPVSVLPWFLKGIAYLLPTTYAIRAANKAVYMQASLNELQMEMTILFGFAVGLLLLSLKSFGFAVKKAKQYGNLAHY